MNIRPSLRLYFFASVVLLSALMAIGFSVLSVNYFIDGLDRGINGTMLQISQSTNVKAGQSKNVLGFNVASRWQDTPSIIQEQFALPPTEEGELYKSKIQESMFSMPKNLYFVVLYKTLDGENRYVSIVMSEKDRPTKMDKGNPKQRIFWISVIALGAIALFAFVLIMIMQKIAKPIESLRSWARQLDSSNIDQNPPDFSYAELNALAEIVRSSLVSAHDSLAREQQFLSYASHELRTPISVIRSNVDLLKRLHEKSPLTDKQQNTLARIERAGLTMSDLTETLLWLSRNDEQQTQAEETTTVNLHNEVDQLSTELNYLLNGKDVKVNITDDNQTPSASVINTNGVACHIVLSNLIRNAYQHTQQGEVTITLTASRVCIVNTSMRSNDANQMPKTKQTKAMGYGLGLELSEKIVRRYGWDYTINETPGSYEVVIDFTITKPTTHKT